MNGWRGLLAGLLALLSSGVVWAMGPFTEPFDGAPPAPQPYAAVSGLAAWDVTVHSRDGPTWHQLEAMDAHHGPDCASPPATHHLPGAYADAVFQCNNHVMTAIQAGGYGVIYLTPPVVADWTDGPAVIQWDMSTLRTSVRDWVDLWVSPMEDHLQLPLEDWLPDLNGVPRRAVHIKMDNSVGGTILQAFTTANFVESLVAGNWWTGYDSFLTPSAARRDTFQLTLSSTHIKFGMPAYNFYWVDADIPDLGWTSGVVQLGHHSYNPLKDCTPGPMCAPDTWHFDNVSVTPAQPFTITRADQPVVDPSTPSTVTFPIPAEVGSHLRFAGVGGSFEYSLDGGGTWHPMGLQTAERDNPDKARNWWQAVPAGTEQVQIRGTGGWWGSWYARDISLWSQVEPTARRTPTPTPAASPTPTPAASPTAPPTVTPGPTATERPSPTPLPTVTPPAPDHPTATPLPRPRCARVDVVEGGLVYTPLANSQCLQ